MSFVEPKSEAWYKSGLAKSAFTPKIYGGLPLDTYQPLFDEAFQMYRIRMKKDAGLAVYPKFYMLHDAALMFYRDYATVISSLKKQPKRAWQKLVANVVKTSDFMRINEVTRGSTELAALAAAKFLASILRVTADRMSEKKINGTAVDFLDRQSPGVITDWFPGSGDGKPAPAPDIPGTPGASGSGSGGVVTTEDIVKALEDTKRTVEDYKQARDEGEEAAGILGGGAGGNSYAHDALSVWAYLENPDEFRRRVRILRWAAIMLKEFSNTIPTSLQHQQMISLYGGITGISRMTVESQLRDITPQELAALAVRNERLAKLLKYDFLLRLLSKQVTVYQRAATIKPVIFVDKSGSMAEYFEADIPKISVAAGFALALYRKLNGEVYLFDTEVERVKPSDVVKTLLTIEADGGTNITEVFRTILEIGRKDYIYIIVTDAIEHPDENMIGELFRRGLGQRVRFIIVPPAWEEPWLQRFWYRKVTDLASFRAAARASLSV